MHHVCSIDSMIHIEWSGRMCLNTECMQRLEHARRIHSDLMSPRNHIVPTVAELFDFGAKSVLAKHKGRDTGHKALCPVSLSVLFSFSIKSGAWLIKRVCF